MKVTEVRWKDALAPCPSARSGHRLVTVGGSLLLFGGYTEHRFGDESVGELKQEVWCYNIATEKWKLLVTNEEDFPASTASCAVVSFKSKVIVFGGSGAYFGRTNSNKLQILDMETLQWSTVQLQGDALQAGYGHSISLTEDGFLYLYGGTDGQGHVILR